MGNRQTENLSKPSSTSISPSTHDVYLQDIPRQQAWGGGAYIALPNYSHNLWVHYYARGNGINSTHPNNLTFINQQLQQIEMRSLGPNSKAISATTKSTNNRAQPNKPKPPTPAIKRDKSVSTQAQRADRSTPKPTNSKKKEASTPVTPGTKKQNNQSIENTQKKVEKYLQVRHQQLASTKPSRFQNKILQDKIQASEDHKINELQEYLKDDTERMRQMKVQSDRHVIEEMRLAHANLNRKLNEAQNHTQSVIENYRLEINQMKSKQAAMMRQHQINIREMNKELERERGKAQQLQGKLADSQRTISRLQADLSMRKKECEDLSRKNEHTTSQNPETSKRIKIMEGEISALQEKVSYLSNIKQGLDEAIIQHRREKDEIRKRSEQVLSFLRAEYKRDFV